MSLGNFILIGVFILTSCSGIEEPDLQRSYLDHEEQSDFEPVTLRGKADESSANFDRHSIVSEGAFLDVNAMSVSQMQEFLANTPYKRSSWLASEKINNVAVSEIIVKVAKANRINPLMLLARLQVEGSHIAKAERPSQRSRDRALGCGCFDNQACQGKYLGLEKQLNCAAGVLRKRYDGSLNGDGKWVKGKSRDTLDPLSVTPVNHATASLYAYTPWVLEKKGGNWLVWNITRRFIKHGNITFTEPKPETIYDMFCSDKNDGQYCFDATDKITCSSKLSDRVEKCTQGCENNACKSTSDFCKGKADANYCEGKERIICQGGAISSSEVCKSTCEDGQCQTAQNPNFCVGKANTSYCDSVQRIDCLNEMISTNETCEFGCFAGACKGDLNASPDGLVTISEGEIDGCASVKPLTAPSFLLFALFIFLQKRKKKATV